MNLLKCTPTPTIVNHGLLNTVFSRPCLNLPQFLHYLSYVTHFTFPFIMTNPMSDFNFFPALVWKKSWLKAVSCFQEKSFISTVLERVLNTSLLLATETSSIMFMFIYIYFHSHLLQCISQHCNNTKTNNSFAIWSLIKLGSMAETLSHIFDFQTTVCF